MNPGQSATGREPPWNINVVVEIPLHRGGVGESEVSVYYPGNFGFIPETAMADGESCPVLVVGSVSVLPGAILRSRPIGVLTLADQQGGAHIRLIAVPRDRLHPFFAHTSSFDSLPAALLDQIVDFFQSIRDTGDNQPLQVVEWGDAETAARLIAEAAARYHATGEDRSTRVAC
ncbi:MAG: inorganic diphosphatase [Rhodospirillaceae bacterium]